MMADISAMLLIGAAIVSMIIISYWALSRPWAWALILFFLGVIGLDSGQGGLVPKVLLIAALGLGLLIPSGWSKEEARARRLGAGPALVVGWILIITLPQMAIFGTPVASWLRDALTYLLFVAFVLVMNRFRIDRSQADRLLVIGTLVASSGFAVTWISRRGIGLYEEVYLLGSKSVLGVLLAMAFGRALSRPGLRSGLGWLALATVPLIAVLMTGTRSGLFLLPIVVVQFIVHSKLRLSGMLKIAALACVAVLGLLWVSGQRLLLGAGAPEDYATDRVSIFLASLLSGTMDDQVSSGRFYITQDAMERFAEHPFFGWGLGSYQYVDSYAVTLAKFGLLGSAVLLYCVGSILRVAWQRAQFGEDRLAIIGVLAGLISLSLVAAVFEDKGLGLGLGLLLATIGCESSTGGVAHELGEPSRHDRHSGKGPRYAQRRHSLQCDSLSSRTSWTRPNGPRGGPMLRRHG